MYSSKLKKIGRSIITFAVSAAVITASLAFTIVFTSAAAAAVPTPPEGISIYPQSSIAASTGTTPHDPYYEIARIHDGAVGGACYVPEAGTDLNVSPVWFTLTLNKALPISYFASIVRQDAYNGGWGWAEGFRTIKGIQIYVSDTDPGGDMGSLSPADLAYDSAVSGDMACTSSWADIVFPTKTGKYITVLVTSAHSDVEVNIDEIALGYTSNYYKNANVSVYAVSSRQYWDPSGILMENVTNEGSGWHTIDDAGDPSPHYITFDFGKAVSLTAFGAQSRILYTNAQAIKKFNLYFSDTPPVYSDETDFGGGKKRTVSGLGDKDYEGEFANQVGLGEWNEADFAPIMGRYLTVEITETFGYPNCILVVPSVRFIAGEIPSYNISQDTYSNGSISHVASAKPGEMVTVTVTPDSGYRLKAGMMYYNYTVNSKNVRAPLYARVNSKVYGTGEYSDSPANEFVFKMPASDISIDAVFISDAADAADDNLGVFGASYQTVGGEGLQFGSRLYLSVNHGGKEYVLQSCGTLMVHAGATAAQYGLTGPSGQTWKAFLEGNVQWAGHWKNIPTTSLYDRSTAHIDMAARLINMAGFMTTEYSAITYAEYAPKDGVGEPLYLEAAPYKAVSLQGVQDYAASIAG